MTAYWPMFVFNMIAVYYIEVKQVIYNKHSCMISLVFIWLCTVQLNLNFTCVSITHVYLVTPVEHF